MSGQKVILNGGLNFLIFDGWWVEVFDGQNGFVIGKGMSYMLDEIIDMCDVELFY